MENINYYPNPVPVDVTDLGRYTNDELQRIRDSFEYITNILADQDAVRVENAVLRGSTTFTSPTLTNYPNGFLPAPSDISPNPQQITYDETAGTITIGETGIYNISGYVAQSVGNNNANYAWGIMVNGVLKLVLGTTVWAQQSNAYTYYSAADFLLIAGDVLRIDAIDTLTNITVVASNFEVRMVSNPQNIVIAAGLVPSVWEY